MKIRVTQDHINRGVRCKSSLCPIALAIQEVTGNQDIRVGRYRIFWIEQRDNVGLLLTPDQVREWIKNFDKVIPVLPFEFDLEIPSFLIKGESK